MIYIGADPELFFQTQDKKYKSCIGLIGGSKDHPLLIDSIGNAVQEDNVACEFNIPPCQDEDSFVKNISFNLRYLNGIAVRHGFHLAMDASAEFDMTELMHPKAMEFGCDPDFNAWTQRINPRPSAKNKTLRSCGGHIHVGAPDLDPWYIGRAMDLYLGLPSLEMDQDTRRRELYGKAGAMRRKPYGMEYRTLSNFWLKSEDTMRWAFRQTLTAVNKVSEGLMLEDRRIQEAIDTNNQGLARDLMREYGV